MGKKVGSPLTYTKKIGDEICLKISTCGYGLAQLCRENPHWPCRQTIFEWRIKVKEFGDSYAKSKQEQVEYLVDEMIDIADDTTFDTTIRHNKDGSEYEVANNEWINRSRLRIDTRKWLAANLAPRVYGDKKQEKENTESLENVLASMKEIALKCLQPK